MQNTVTSDCVGLSPHWRQEVFALSPDVHHGFLSGQTLSLDVRVAANQSALKKAWRTLDRDHLTFAGEYCINVGRKRLSYLHKLCRALQKSAKPPPEDYQTIKDELQDVSIKP